MSTLNEIAMNHARMVKRLAEESITVHPRQPLVVGAIEVSSIDTPPHLPLHLLIEGADYTLADSPQASGL